VARALVRAIETLHMVFQPIVSWTKRDVTAYEALVRTREPSLARPDLLFSAAERLDMIVPLGRRIRAEVARSIEETPAAASVFVNVHGGELADDDLYAPDAPLSRVADRVVLEITERWSLDNFHDVRERMHKLRMLGFRIAVDDLGAGYAGLTSFARLRPEVVKLDMSLVRGVHEDPTRQHLIRSLNGVCSDLGIRVVAEGVETREERDVLVALGSDLLQGYLFGRPEAGFRDVNLSAWEHPMAEEERTGTHTTGHHELLELRDSLVRLLSSLASTDVNANERVFRAGELGALGQRTLRSLDSVLRTNETKISSDRGNSAAG
jgi:EAL domain-containing protein (putative c-di-GMP-specific phosphodiesterase class I)